MLIEETGNILNSKYHWIAHQVNCKGVMGKGLALQIKNHFPFVFRDYKKALEYEHAGLGHVVVSRVMGLNGREIFSMFAQDDYGYGKRFTDYDAFQECLDSVAWHINSYSYDAHPDWCIAFPKGIGCGLAGGDWNVIRPMIEEFSKKIKFDTYIVKYGG